jgi:hypothetical protein
MKSNTKTKKTREQLMKEAKEYDKKRRVESGSPSKNKDIEADGGFEQEEDQVGD